MVIRIGRTVGGILERMLPPRICDFPQSTLLIGKPNSGKTTVLREFARVLSNNEDKVVVVIDKTCEIAGAAASPHPSIGISCRWVPVDDPANQAQFMGRAIENLSPDIVIVDEISSEKECRSAKSIAQRGVQLIATCHGSSMAELINDDERAILIGGVKAVTLSKQEVSDRERQGIHTGKQVMMRKCPPLFGRIIELHSRNCWFIHDNPAASVDAWLKRLPIVVWKASPGQIEQVIATPTESGFNYDPGDVECIRILPGKRHTMAVKCGRDPSSSPSSSP